MKALASLFLAVVMMGSVVSAGEFDGVKEQKTSFVVVRDFAVKAELFPIAKSLKFKSKENGKTCDLRYPATTKNYVLPAGTKFPLEMVVPEGSFPGYGLYVFFTIPGFGAFSQSGLV